VPGTFETPYLRRKRHTLPGTKFFFRTRSPPTILDVVSQAKLLVVLVLLLLLAPELLPLLVLVHVLLVLMFQLSSTCRGNDMPISLSESHCSSTVVRSMMVAYMQHIDISSVNGIMFSHLKGSIV
jgi:hypothetical protein